MTTLPLTHRDAEASNLAFETAQLRESGPRFLLVPVGLVHGNPERAMITPKIHFESRSGGYLGKHMQHPGTSRLGLAWLCRTKLESSSVRPFAVRSLTPRSFPSPAASSALAGVLEEHPMAARDLLLFGE